MMSFCGVSVVVVGGGGEGVFVVVGYLKLRAIGIAISQKSLLNSCRDENTVEMTNSGDVVVFVGVENQMQKEKQNKKKERKK